MAKLTKGQRGLLFRDYLSWFTRRLFDEYRITRYQVRFSSRKSGSYHSLVQTPQGPVHKIVYGDGSIIRPPDHGFREYKRIEFALGGRALFGFQAIHQLALHEFAHVLDTERNGRKYGVAHGAGFVAAYHELMRHFECDHCLSDYLFTRRPMARMFTESDGFDIGSRSSTIRVVSYNPRHRQYQPRLL